jgi:transcriptional regulator with XRE-family HTH domain
VRPKSWEHGDNAVYASEPERKLKEVEASRGIEALDDLSSEEQELQRLIEEGVSAGAGTVEDLARETGVAYATLHAWTSGRRRPSRPNLLRLANVLDQRSERLALVASALRRRLEGRGRGRNGE